ncbi:MAG TPA: hypothetical protein VIL33_04545 [Rhodothermia bacterium]
MTNVSAGAGATGGYFLNWTNFAPLETAYKRTLDRLVLEELILRKLPACFDHIRRFVENMA